MRIMRRAPDSIGDFGTGRFVTDTLRVDVRMADVDDARGRRHVPDRRRGLEVRSEPTRDAEHLIWMAEARIL